eukprot:TRINITY_DN18219_c0_g1_i1.p1 TRINITY_DN18219_c0_g1~~TRINITY_DN18219_c0_g1_i1.p1  ORF type:complete len:1174 (-),score=270.18 TRINITY_DN18219_c0_g1_i1:46-3567(-)
MFLKSFHRASAQNNQRNNNNNNTNNNNANNNGNNTNNINTSNNNIPTSPSSNWKKAEEVEGPLDPLVFTEYDPVQIQMDGIKVFGTPLKDLLEHDKKILGHLEVPLFFREAVKHIINKGLSVEGIFKHAGTGPEVQEYRERVDRGDFDFSGVQDIYTVGNLIKAFIRELPEPLLGIKTFTKWIAIPDIEDEQTLDRQLNQLLSDLPTVNQHVLGELMFLLFLVDNHYDQNRINADELSVIFGKDLLWKGDRYQMDFTVVTKINDLIRILIIDYEHFFEAEEDERSSEHPDINALARFKKKITIGEKSIICLEESTNRRFIWSGDSQGTIRIWSADEMRSILQVETNNGGFFEIKSVGKDMWCASSKNLEVRDERGNLKKTDSSITFSVCPIRDSKELWACVEGKIKIWDISKMTVIKEIPFPPGAMYCKLKQVGDNVWGAFSHRESVIRVWNIKNRQLIREINGHTRKVNSIIEVGKDRVWTGSEDRTIKVWNPKTFELIKTLRRHKEKIYDLIYTGTHVWSGSWDKSIVIWDADSLEPVIQFSDFQTDAVSCFLLHYNHNLQSWAVWSSSYDKSINVFVLPECTLDEPKPTDDIGHTGMDQSMAAGLNDEGDDFMRTSMGLPRTKTLLISTGRRKALGTTRGHGWGISTAGTGAGATGSDAHTADGNMSQWEISMDDIKDKGKTLGTGSFGTVYKAKLNHKEVAVKQLFAQKMDQKTLDEFKKEVSIMSTLRHPNILLFMGACCEPGSLLIVTEVMPMGSVHDILRDKSIALTFRRKMLFAKDAALGVNWLHRFEPQFLHLDLKAANLLVDQKWTVKVADFGLSVVKPKDHNNPEKKIKHGPIGTPLWMAPEVLMNKEYDEKADVYSFGIVMFEILTGTDPWEDIASLVDLVDAVVSEKRRPPLPQDIPTTLKNLIHSLWHPDPNSRPSFRDIAPAFDEVIVDGLLRDPAARQLWRSNFLGKDKISFLAFVQALVHEVNRNCKDDRQGLAVPKTLEEADKELKLRCLQKVLGKKEDREEREVKIEAFSELLKWYGPLDENILNRIQAEMEQPYFWGDISTIEAQARLAKQKKGTFLVRYSTTTPGAYAVSVRVQGEGPNGVTHYRLQRLGDRVYVVHGRPANEKYESLHQLIKANAKAFGATNPCEGSEYYAVIYQHTHNVESSGYGQGWED